MNRTQHVFPRPTKRPTVEHTQIPVGLFVLLWHLRSSCSPLSLPPPLKGVARHLDGWISTRPVGEAGQKTQLGAPGAGGFLGPPQRINAIVLLACKRGNAPGDEGLRRGEH